MFKVDATARVEEAPGFRRMFAAGRLTLGLFFPIEAFPRDQPTMRDQERLAVRAQALGFAALWCRDVPLRDPSFGDVGQVYDPWVYLGWIGAITRRHRAGDRFHRAAAAPPAARGQGRSLGGPAVARAAGAGRGLGRPSGGVPGVRRGHRTPRRLFREDFETIRHVLETEFPVLKTSRGVLTGAADLVPKPIGRLPLLVTGNSGQPLPWIAAHADGWITYPRSIERQAETVARWRAQVQEAAPGRFKPFAQSLYVDLDANPQLPPTPIHLGFKSGRQFLLRFLEASRGIGVNHVILNLKYGARPADEVLEEIGLDVLPALARDSENGMASADQRAAATTSR